VKKDKRQLLFVYNANSGLGNAMLDTAHKILNPATYSCSLCQLTFGAFSEKANWKHFRKTSTMPMAFMHKDEFAHSWGDEIFRSYEFPSIFLQETGKIQLLVNAAELNAMVSEAELMQRVEEIINAFGKN